MSRNVCNFSANRCGWQILYDSRAPLWCFLFLFPIYLYRGISKGGSFDESELYLYESYFLLLVQINGSRRFLWLINQPYILFFCTAGLGYFNVVHSLTVAGPWLCAADRENGQIQCFNRTDSEHRGFVIRQPSRYARVFAIDYSDECW